MIETKECSGAPPDWAYELCRPESHIFTGLYEWLCIGPKLHVEAHAQG